MNRYIYPLAVLIMLAAGAGCVIFGIIELKSGDPVIGLFMALAGFIALFNYSYDARLIIRRLRHKGNRDA